MARKTLRRLGRGAVVLVASASLAFTGAHVANAAYYAGGMKTQSFCVKNPSVNDTWLAPLNNGRNKWNSRSAFPGNISVFSGCPNLLKVGTYSGDWLGIYYPLIPGSQYEINLNSPKLNAHVKATGGNFANVVTSTTAHEFGHALKLHDIQSPNNRLMSHNRNRTIQVGPNAVEITESNGYY